MGGNPDICGRTDVLKIHTRLGTAGVKCPPVQRSSLIALSTEEESFLLLRIEMKWVGTCGQLQTLVKIPNSFARKKELYRAVVASSSWINVGLSQVGDLGQHWNSTLSD